MKGGTIQREKHSRPRIRLLRAIGREGQAGLLAIGGGAGDDARLDGFVQGVGSLQASLAMLREIQQTATDAGLGQPDDTDLLAAGYDWFTGAELVAAFTAVTTIRTAAEAASPRAALNKVRRGI